MGEIESFGGSSTPVNEKALEAVANFIREVQPNGMVQKFVLILETIEPEDRYISSFTAPGQKKWDTLGLLGYATAVESNDQVQVTEYPDEDDI